MSVLKFNKYVRPRNTRTLAASRSAPSCESRWVCAARPVKIRKRRNRQRDRQRDGRTDGHQTVTLRLPLNAASVKTTGVKNWTVTSSDPTWIVDPIIRNTKSATVPNPFTHAPICNSKASVCILTATCAYWIMHDKWFKSFIIVDYLTSGMWPESGPKIQQLRTPLRSNCAQHSEWLRFKEVACIVSPL